MEQWEYNKSEFETHSPLVRISRKGDNLKICDTDHKHAPLIATLPEMYEALKCAEVIIKVARKYFPKSIKNSDRFDLENTCATIGKVIHKIESEGE